MSNEQPGKKSATDEIDLGDLFRNMGNLFSSFVSRIKNLIISLFKSLLLLYVYLRKNIAWFLGLSIVGFVAGYVLINILGDKYELSIIVTPNLDSGDYLYSIVGDIQSDIEQKDTLFFASLGMDVEKMDGFEIEIKPLKAENALRLEQEMEFIELLKTIPDLPIPQGLVEGIVQSQMSKDQAITIYFKDAEIGEDYANKLLTYIKSNPYYEKMNNVFVEIANERIKQNTERINQLDTLIGNYAKKMLTQQSVSANSLLLDSPETVNVPTLFQLKSDFLRDTEEKMIELQRREGAFTTIKLGKPRKADVSITENNLFVIPFCLVAIFVLIDIIKYLNRVSREVLSR